MIELLNIPVLMRRLYPNGKYILHGRTYEDIEWLDHEVLKPSIEILAGEQARIDLEEKVSVARASQAVKRHELTDDHLNRQAKEIAQPLINEMLENQKRLRQELAEKLFEHERASGLKETEALAVKSWEKISKSASEKKDAALKLLKETDWYCIRYVETGLAIPEAVAANRKAARDAIEQAQYVFADWAALRAKEYPSHEERVEALRQGGLRALEMIKQIEEVNKKYPKP